MTQHLIECKALTKRFGSVYALRDLSIRLPHGKIIGLLGPN